MDDNPFDLRWLYEASAEEVNADSFNLNLVEKCHESSYIVATRCRRKEPCQKPLSDRV